MRNTMRLAIGAMTAIALLAGTAVSATAAPLIESELDPVPVTGTIDFSVPTAGGLPIVDSEVGRGAPLGTAAGSLVQLGPDAAGMDAALVRIAVLSPASETTIYRSGSVEAMRTPAGVSASTTVLLPVDGQGRAQLWASGPAHVRLEVLAAFTGSAGLPGSTIPLQDPVLRADTANGLAGSGIGAESIVVGLTGQGGIPSERVRSAYVTATVELDHAGSIELGGQRVPLPAGRTTFTTILAPGENGAVAAKTTGGAKGHLRLHVIGWIPEAPEFATQLSLEGSFVPTASLEESYSQRVTEERDDFQTLTRNEDASYSIGLAGLTATAETETTLFEFGPEYEGRARGAVVDSVGGAAPQLVLVPAGEEGDGFTLRRGEARLSWLPVGDILGAERNLPSAPPGDFSIAIDTHREGQRVDLSENGYFTLGGTITSEGAASSIDRVEISVQGESEVGTADVWSEAGVLRWEADLSAPESGDHTYEVRAFDRGGSERGASITLDVERFTDDDTVVAPDVWLLNDGSTPNEAREVEGEPDTVYVSADVPLKPGDTLVADAGAALPEGLFAEVVSFDRIGDEWRVRTELAKIEDVFLQVDVDVQNHLYEDLAESTLDESGFEAGLELGDEPVPVDAERLPGDAGYDTAEVVTGDEVDLEPFSDSCDPTAEAEGAGNCPAIPVSATADRSGMADISTTLLTGRTPGPRTAASGEFSAAFGFKANTKLITRDKDFRKAQMVDLGSSTADPKTALANDVKQAASKGEMGIGIALAAQAVPKVSFVLDTEITWKWRVIPTGVTVVEFSLEFENTLKAEAELSLYLKYEAGLNFYQNIVSIGLPTLTIMAGPVPIVIQNKIDLILRANLELEASASLTLGFSRTDTVGTKYTPSGGWESLNKPAKTASLPLGVNPVGDLGMSFKGSLTVGPVIQPKTALYGVAGPELNIGIRAGLSGELKGSLADGKISFNAQLFAEMGYAVTVKFKLFSLEWDRTLAERKFKFVFWEREWTVYERSPASASLRDSGGTARSYAASRDPVAA